MELWMPNTFCKPLFQAAMAVHRATLKPTASDSLPDLTADYCQLFQKLERQLHRAEERGWNFAAAVLSDRLANMAEQLKNCLIRYLSQLRQVQRQAASVADIYHDLLALEEDFQDVHVDDDEGEICATCEPIVLEGMHFGPFEIRLSLSPLKQSRSYRVVALEPRPAGNNSSVTHPHVSDERLCEGDGAAAIRAALQAGRIGDFFLLVAQILATYGRGRAYVELDEWDGEPCHDCGTHVAEDDRCYCSRCDALLCEECCSGCPECDQSSCDGCLESCSSCGANRCCSCLAKCAKCHEDVCENCIDHNVCSKCQETHEEVDQDDQEPSPAVTAVAVQPLCLGEATVSA